MLQIFLGDTLYFINPHTCAHHVPINSTKTRPFARESGSTKRWERVTQVLVTPSNSTRIIREIQTTKLVHL